MAEMILRQMLKKEGIENREIFSRGLSVWPHQPISEEARQILEAAGVKVDPHASRALSAADVQRADLILTMTENHKRMIIADYPEAKAKTRLLAGTDIADPVGGSPNDYEKCRIEIQNALLDLYTQLKGN